MAVAQDQRPTFYQEQYLGPDDLTTTVEYSRIRLARHSLGAHTWGIAIGMQIIEKPSPAGNNQVDVFITPGYAWDGFGRPIVVLAPYKIPAQLFQNIVGDASVDNPAVSGDSAAGHPVGIWLQYSESANNPAPNGFQACDVSNQTSRIQETFVVQIGDLTNAPDQRDPVSVGGKQVDAQQALTTFDPNAPQIYDLSIPEQALPDDDAQAVWLVPIGCVRWLPAQTPAQAGAFQQRTKNDQTKSESVRQYIGVVAGAVEAAGQNVQVKLRGNASSGIVSDDLLWVEGKMRVEDDVNLFGGKLTFLNSGGQDEGVPLLLQRNKQIDPNSLQTLTSLQIEIGKDNKGNNMLSVGPLDNSKKVAPVFNVLDSGKAGVGTITPRNPFGVRASGQWEELLSFENPSGITKWHINQNPNGNNSGLNFAETGVADFRIFIQAGGNIGMGTQSPTGRLTLSGIVQPAQGNLTLFSQTADVEYDGGNDQLFIFSATGNASTAFMGGKVGIGTTTPTNRLHVGDVTGIRQNRLYMSGDAGWSSITYNAYHDPTNSTWVFPDSTRTAVTIEMDDTGGTGRFEVWSTTSAAKTSWVKRFRIDGETGAATVYGSFDVEGGPITLNGALTVNGAISLNGGMSMNGGVNFSGGVGFDGGVSFNGGVGFNSSVSINGTDITAALQGLSDLRLKTDIEPLSDSLAKLLSLRGVRFHWKEPGKRGTQPGPQMGLIAQEVEHVFPDWVKENADGYKVINQQGVVPLMIEAIKELKLQIDALAERLNGKTRN